MAETETTSWEGREWVAYGVVMRWRWGGKVGIEIGIGIRIRVGIGGGEVCVLVWCMGGGVEGYGVESSSVGRCSEWEAVSF